MDEGIITFKFLTNTCKLELKKKGVHVVVVGLCLVCFFKCGIELWIMEYHWYWQLDI